MTERVSDKVSCREATLLEIESLKLLFQNSDFQLGTTTFAAGADAVRGIGRAHLPQNIHTLANNRGGEREAR